jgi:hypothetical protein
VYARVELADRDRFAERAVSALDDPTVRRDPHGRRAAGSDAAMREGRRLPVSFIATDFYEQGELVPVARELNAQPG